MYCLYYSVVTCLSIIGRQVGVLGGSWFLHCLGGEAGCHRGPPLWPPCLLSKIYGGSCRCIVVEERFFCGAGMCGERLASAM